MVEQLISLSGSAELEEIGGKARNLMDLMAAGFPVPEGMVVGAKAYDAFLERNGLKERIRKALEGLDYSDAVKLVRAAETIRGWVMAGEMDSALTETLLRDTERYGADSLWAVRSSAIAEDLEQASFAGQQDTYLNVTRPRLAEQVRRCWAS